MNWIAVFIGGGLGSVFRYGISTWTYSWTEKFPLGTLISNVLASLILALIVYQFSKSIKVDSLMFLLVAVGFCGGFSTFSTFSLETFRLLDKGYLVLAMSNIVLNIIICLGIVWMMWRVSKAV